MKTLIFEGIATSGKSRIITGLQHLLQDQLTIAVVPEERTHQPIMTARNELQRAFFGALVDEVVAQGADLMLFDRLYLTQAYRAAVDLSAYDDLEQALLPYHPHTVLLTVQETAIADRIEAAAAHRDPRWRIYLQSKGATFAEIAQEYITQQRGLEQLLGQSKLPYTVFDTTNHNYAAICQRLVTLIKN
jgi:hypothetical protein